MRKRHSHKHWRNTIYKSDDTAIDNNKRTSGRTINTSEIQYAKKTTIPYRLLAITKKASITLNTPDTLLRKDLNSTTLFVRSGLPHNYSCAQ